MGSALARAAAPKAGDLLLADHAQEKARALAAELGGRCGGPTDRWPGSAT